MARFEMPGDDRAHADALHDDIAHGAGASTGGALPETLTGATGGESGLNTRRDLAAALILCGGNAARAQRLCVAVQNYPAELDKWLSAILSDDDKSKLAKLASVATADATARDAAAPKAASAPTAMAAAMVKARAGKGAKAAAA